MNESDGDSVQRRKSAIGQGRQAVCANPAAGARPPNPPTAEPTCFEVNCCEVTACVVNCWDVDYCDVTLAALMAAFHLGQSALITARNCSTLLLAGSDRKSTRLNSSHT